MLRARQPDRRRPVLGANLLFVLLGAGLVGLAIAAGPAWSDRHFLPAFAQPHSSQARMLDLIRLAVAMLGLALILLVRPLAMRAVALGRGRHLFANMLSAALAVAAAFVATELILRTGAWRNILESPHRKQPLRLADGKLGWILAPNHAGRGEIRGQTTDYATDDFGYRVRSLGDRVDFAKPTILFAGESILFGYGLPWRDTVPARVEAMTGLQSANLAVNAYSTDQSYLRLRQEIGRFRRPAAIVILFMPLLFDRNLDRDRPYLDTRLRWHPAEPPPLRLVELGRRLVRYRSSGSIARGVAMTRNVLRATLDLARSHNISALIVVPQFMPEDPGERAVRRMVLDEARLPYLLVPLKPGWRLPEDRHPDARGDRAIAEAIAARLRPSLKP
jgi:hypothetical protein